MAEYMSEYMSGRMPDRMPDEMSEYMSDRMPDRLPDRMPGGMSEYMLDRMPEYMSNRMRPDMSWWGSLEAKLYTLFQNIPKYHSLTNHDHVFQETWFVAYIFLDQNSSVLQHLELAEQFSLK